MKNIFFCVGKEGIGIQNTPKLTKTSVKKSGVPFLKSNLYEEQILRYCHC
jgi:hypothetical protein